MRRSESGPVNRDIRARLASSPSSSVASHSCFSMELIDFSSSESHSSGLIASDMKRRLSCNSDKIKRASPPPDDSRCGARSAPPSTGGAAADADAEEGDAAAGAGADAEEDDAAAGVDADAEEDDAAAGAGAEEEDDAAAGADAEEEDDAAAGASMMSDRVITIFDLHMGHSVMAPKHGSQHTWSQPWGLISTGRTIAKELIERGADINDSINNTRTRCGSLQKNVRRDRRNAANGAPRGRFVQRRVSRSIQMHCHLALTRRPYGRSS